MSQLTSPVPVHVTGPGYPITTIWPDEEIPEWALDQLEPALKGEGDAPAAEVVPGSSGDAPGLLTEEQLRELTVPDLKLRLDSYQPPVEYTASARKDDLVELALKAQTPSGD